MNVIGIPCNIVANPKPYFNLFGNNIYFRGLDDEKNMEGFPSHIAFVNEALEIHKSQIDGILMRCTELFAMDWNPKYSEHWAYDFEKRPNCLFTHSTYKNNKHLPQQVISEIESYNPDIEKNIVNKTADKYRWDVYGLGKRASQEGLVYTKGKDYDIIKEIPKEIHYKLMFKYIPKDKSFHKYMKIGDIDETTKKIAKFYRINNIVMQQYMRFMSDEYIKSLVKNIDAYEASKEKINFKKKTK
jgi:PBSX family phage terminase large subunit